ncbi:uncharacterized protein LOC135428447 isoform X2 [Drosophila montana]|uniref:uncharacterized protein LOC135428447 isoform X2 n=1 Tax=Drosophila montana TaxID=40370 RepID=UPI00313EC47C
MGSIQNTGWIISFAFFAAYVLTMTDCGVLENSGQPQIIQLSVGERCPEKIGHPASTCQIAESCTTLVAYKHLEYSVTVCGFVSHSGQETVCCPDPVETTKPAPPSPAPTTEIIPVQMSSHLASLGYYSANTQDEIVYRCTAIILSPTQLLATTKCLGAKIYEKPNRVLVGVTDPSISLGSELEFELTKGANNDTRVSIKYKYSGCASTDESIGSCLFLFRQKES